MVRALDAKALGRWAQACVVALEQYRDAINQINVYPVADADTGTNLLHTMRSAANSLPDSEAVSAGEIMALLAQGAVTGALGNSGTILSQFLRGCAETWAELDEVNGSALAAGLAAASRAATTAVAAPVDGTVLSVLAAAAESAQLVGDQLGPVALAALHAAEHALAETPRQLAVLAECQVVDAGGYGLVVLLQQLVNVVTGDSCGSVRPDSLASAHAVPPARKPDDSPLYEVMYLSEGTEQDADQLRVRLTSVGESVVVAGDGNGRWSVHVHCADIGQAIEAGLDLGRPRNLTVTALTRSTTYSSAEFAGARAVVALATAEDTGQLFLAEGAAVLVVRPESNPADLLDVLTTTKAGHITLLPNDVQRDDLVSLATAQAERLGRHIVVVPMASPVQGLAALAVHDPGRRPGDDVVAMAEAAAATRRGELIIATSQAMTWAGLCEPGDALGFANGEVVLLKRGPVTELDLCVHASELVDRMLAAGGELVTVLLGAAAPAELPTAVETHLRNTHPEVEFVSYFGGQADAVVRIGVE